jgi:poly-gamma-glutamate capsule biosynthesis protein CapA/YwtB (metallophosphatase superfamily)
MFWGVPARLTTLVVMLSMAFQFGALAHPVFPDESGALADGQVSIVGGLDLKRERIDARQITVHINGVKAVLDENAHYATEVAQAAYYQVYVSGPRIFTLVQTFGNGEIEDDSCNCLSIPSIEPVARKPGRIELFFGGDSMAGRRYFKSGQGREAVLDPATLDSDLDRLFAPMRPYFQTSDLASINLESVVAAEQPGPPAPKKYLFYSPPELPGALARAGIDHVSLGNNHTADYRDAGMRTTIEALDAAGIGWSGAGMDQDEAERAFRSEVDGEKLGIFGFVGWRGSWTPNQTATPEKAGAAWGLRSAVERVTRRERRAGYTPIMHFHGNKEYSDRPSEISLSRFRTAVEKGAPLVIGHHPHVTHGLEIYRDSLIAHSLGNFLFDQEHPHTHVTYSLKVWLENGKFLRAEAIPMQVLDYRPVPAVGRLREAVLRRLYWLSAEMGTQLYQSGGHAVVWAKEPRLSQTECKAPGPFRISNFAPTCLAQGAEFGRNMVPRGDFENASHAEARDRFWSARNAAIDYRGMQAGSGYLAVLPEASDKSFYIYSASYLRDVYAAQFSLMARIKAPRDVEVELLVKDRPHDGDKPTSSVKGEVVGSRLIAASTEWQELRLEFSRPIESAGAARAFRPILRFKFLDGAASGNRTVEIDDFALVEWANETDQRDPIQAWRWTHQRPSAPT